MSASSPKRKRGHILPLDTKGPIPRLCSDSDVEDHDEDSPHTKVSRKLDDLEIHGRRDQESDDAEMKHHVAITTPAEQPTEGQAENRNFASPKSKRKPHSPTNVTPEPGNKPPMSPGTASRPKSPPLAGELSDDFWHDSEITGHNPDDPSDDGYGINGIGFKPTAAIAWSRAQRRKQQLSDYKNREARDARQERSERRKRVFDEGDEAPSMESSPRKAIRVHFEDG